MMRVIAWKEFREGRTVWLALALLGIGSIFLLPLFMDVLGEASLEQQQTSIFLTLVVLSVAYGVVVGSMLLAGEREGKTMAFLDALAPRRRDVWLAKTLPGLLLSLSLGFALAIPYVLFSPGDPDGRERMLFLFPVLTVEAFLWGLCSSSFSPSVLGSAGLGGLMFASSSALAFGLSAGGRLLIPQLLVHVFMDLFALCCSLRVFCGPDRERHGQVHQEIRQAPAPSERVLTQTNSWRVLLWLTWRQGRGEVVSLLVVTFLLGVFLTPFMVVGWPLWTLIVGVVFGTSVWRNEQAEGSYRFLVGQRFTPSQVWLVKVGFGLIAALLVLAAGGLGILGQMAPWSAAQVGTSAQPWRKTVNLDTVFLFQNGPIVAPLWMLHGFVVGQLIGLLAQKNLVAIMVAVPLGAGLMAPWLPSLVSGEMPVWQVLLLPVLLLLATRLIYWEWATERLTTTRPVVVLSSLGVLGLFWLLGCLTSRVLAVPGPGEPFDRQGFEDSLAGGADNEGPETIRRAMVELARRRREVGFWPHMGSTDMRVSISGPATRPQQLTDTTKKILKQGWSAASPREIDILTRTFESDWVAMFERGVDMPLGVIEDPRRSTTRSLLNEVQECREAAVAYRLRALQLQAKGEDKDALRHLLVNLRLSLHLRHKVMSVPYQVGQAVEILTLEGLEMWAQQVRDPALITQALQALREHEAKVPSVEDVLKADYIGAYARLVQMYGDLATEANPNQSPSDRLFGQMLLLSQQTPWERLRTQRILDGHYHSLFYGSPASQQLLVRFRGCMLDRRNWDELRQSVTQGLCRQRATQVTLALIQFARTEGRPARNLNELLPRYLDQLPQDPFAKSTFGYRISPGERLTLPTPRPAQGSEAFTLAAGQAVLWSYGPDGVDDRGQVLSPREAFPVTVVQRGDWIFLIP